MKVSELQGAALDWAVAKCEGWPMDIYHDEEQMPMIRDDEVPEWEPSTDWAQGGPIIERERIELRPFDGENWLATDNLTSTATGPTPLVAAIRCYVSSKLGDEIELPEAF